MPDPNGNQKPSDILHRVGIWVAVCGLGMYVYNIGAWVGAADEKFEDAQTVEEKQDQLIRDVVAIQTTQKVQTTAIEGNTRAIEKSKDEILAAIKEASRDD